LAVREDAERALGSDTQPISAATEPNFDTLSTPPVNRTTQSIHDSSLSDPAIRQTRAPQAGSAKVDHRLSSET
jgi:hypothetical protein